MYFKGINNIRYYLAVFYLCLKEIHFEIHFKKIRPYLLKTNLNFNMFILSVKQKNASFGCFFLSL